MLLKIVFRLKSSDASADGTNSGLSPSLTPQLSLWFGGLETAFGARESELRDELQLGSPCSDCPICS